MSVPHILADEASCYYHVSQISLMNINKTCMGVQ
jgi:hypothetical protein